MAIAFTKTRRFDEAIRHYRRALELDSSLAGAHYGLAFLLMQRGDPDGAAQHLKNLPSRTRPADPTRRNGSSTRRRRSTIWVLLPGCRARA